MMCAWLVLFCPSYSSEVLSGVGLVGGNPTMNTPPRLRRGGIASYSSFIFTCVVSGSFRAGAMGSSSFFGFSCLNLLFVFLNLLLVKKVSQVGTLAVGITLLTTISSGGSPPSQKLRLGRIHYFWYNNIFGIIE